VVGVVLVGSVVGNVVGATGALVGNNDTEY